MSGKEGSGGHAIDQDREYGRLGGIENPVDPILCKSKSKKNNLHVIPTYFIKSFREIKI
jgi:hypothetical protein